MEEEFEDTKGNENILLICEFKLLDILASGISTFFQHTCKIV
jgi:hypothetical protein